MSQIFHKSCYTSRSSGYKYRTLSTNTGERKRRDSKEDSTFDRKFNELQRDIAFRVETQLDKTQQARESIRDKFESINAKIDSMINLQKTVVSLRDNLNAVENIIADMTQKLEKIEVLTSNSEGFIGRGSFRYKAAIIDSDEVGSSTVVDLS